MLSRVAGIGERDCYTRHGTPFPRERWGAGNRDAHQHPLAGIIVLTAGARPLATGWRALELTAVRRSLATSRVGLLGVLATSRIGTTPGWFSPGLALQGIVTTVDGTPFFAAGLENSLRSW